MNRSQSKGFTLIELMVVVLVAGILAVIAVPSYRAYLLRSHRVEATAALLKLSAEQEQFYLQNNTYSDELTTAPPDGLGLQAVSENGFYDIAIDSADDAGFQATASAKGGQADDSNCAEFTIDETGTKTAKNSSDAAVTNCWSR